MWIYEDDNRTLEFGDVDQIKAFVLNEIAPGHLARALADNMMSVAASLYDGGWRSGDRAELMAEYNLTEEDADLICGVLGRFEQEGSE